MIDVAEVHAARNRIDGLVRETPLIRADQEPLGLDHELWFKLEYLQHAGSFKPRGAFNRILSARETGELTFAGVITASGGNAGLAVAYAAKRLGFDAEVWVPENAPPVKVRKLRDLGAVVVQQGNEYADAYEGAAKKSAETGALFCHAYDQEAIVAGQGTLGLELIDQGSPIGGFDTVLVAVGGGGLMAGIATALRDEARVVAVEPHNAPTLHAALRTGRPVDVEVSGIAKDSLGARRVGNIALAIAKDTDVQSVLVEDDAIRQARKALWETHRIAVEYGAAAALAGLTSGAYRPTAGERLCVVLCGANTDPSDLH